jgi:hypothetical protein
MGQSGTIGRPTRSVRHDRSSQTRQLRPSRSPRSASAATSSAGPRTRRSPSPYSPPTPAQAAISATPPTPTRTVSRRRSSASGWPIMATAQTSCRRHQGGHSPAVQGPHPGYHQGRCRGNATPAGLPGTRSPSRCVSVPAPVPGGTPVELSWTRWRRCSAGRWPGVRPRRTRQLTNSSRTYRPASCHPLIERCETDAAYLKRYLDAVVLPVLVRNQQQN